MAKHNQNGWGLTETMLALGAMSAMALAIYAVLGPTSASAQVKREQDNLRHLSAAVDRSWGLLGSFEGVSTTKVLEDGLAPMRMRDGGDLRTAWGTGIGVHPHAVSVPNDAFLVSYPLAPAEVCARLASAMARDAYDIRVESRSVFADGRLDPAMAAEQCGGADVASMEFIFHSGLASGTAVAAPVVLPPSVPTITPPPSSPPVITIPGAPSVDPVEPGTPAVPPPSAPPPVLPPPTASPSTPAPIMALPPPSNPPPPPVTPPGVMCAPTPRPLSDQTQRRNCPAGQLGDIYEARTRTQQYTCPEAWDNPEPSHVTYGSWRETSNTCAPVCVAPAPSTENQTLDCPSGQLGAIEQERITTWSCPAATGSPTSTTGGWTTTSNTCQAACVAPPDSTETRTSTKCPAGQSGTITERRTTTYACPAPTGLPTSTTSGWSVVSNTCSTVCVAPARTSTPISRPAPSQTRDNCPAGYTGITPQIRTGTEAGTRTTTWACPTPTGSPTSTTVDTWSGNYTYGAWTANGTNTCAAPPPACVVPNPATQTDTQRRPATQNLGCPAGQYGTRIRSGFEYQDGSRTASCPTSTGPVAWTPWSYGPWERRGTWTVTTDTCKNCPAPATDAQLDWEPRSKACPSDQKGSHTWEEQRRRTRSVSYNCPAGTATLPSPTYGGYGSWSWTGTKRNEVNTCAPSGPALGRWRVVASNWGYGAGPAYRYWTWSTYENGSGWCGDGGDRPPQGPQSCDKRPSTSSSCHVGDSMMFEENESWGGGVQGYDVYECR